MTYDSCLVETFELRVNYCTAKYPFDNVAADYCRDNYCDVCCESELGDGFDI